MEFPSDLHDPLTMNMSRQARVLLSKIPQSSPYAAELLNTSSHRELLTTLSRLLAIPELTLSVAIAFRPILLALCAEWLHTEGNEEEKLVALCLLIQPHEELFPVLSEFLRKSFGGDGPLAFLLTSSSLSAIDSTRLHRLLLAYYRILLANRELPKYFLWPLSPLSMLFWTPHPDTGVRLLSIRCYAMQSGMGEAEREKLETKILGETCGVDCQVDYGQDIYGNSKTIDGWILPVLEIKRIVDARNNIVSEAHDYFNVDADDIHQPILQSDLGVSVTNIHGILLLRSPGPTELVAPLIHTPMAIRSLRALAVHLSLHLPTLITSPPSSGKSLMLSYLASTIHTGASNQIIDIHLADTSMDPRSLLGAYVSSSTHPGTFEWKEGTLIRAMREGKWVVFKDIDKGSNEILGIIMPLVESLRIGKSIGGRASLEVPSRGRVDAHPDFALFATRSLASSTTGKFPSPVFFGARKFYEVVIHPPTHDELKTIINSRFPRLAGDVARALICLWEAVRTHKSAASTRDIGLRELEKFCSRIENLLPLSYQSMDRYSNTDEVSIPAIFPNPTLREDMYIEARDVFLGAGALTPPAQTHMDTIVATIADHLGLGQERRDQFLRGRTSRFQVDKDENGHVTAVSVGRARLLARSNDLRTATSVSRPFVMHRPAVSLLCQLVSALSLGEPLLLTGETATGKTSTVTHLSSLLRRPLVSLNLSHQTESADLIGGFKPVDARVPGSALQERFLELFGSTFSRRKNSNFEESLRRAVLEGKWKRAVGIWKEATRLARGRLQTKQTESLSVVTRTAADDDAPRKRHKVNPSAIATSEAKWITFEKDIDEFEVRYVQAKSKFAFGFVEGPLVKALRSGDWVLLDEINLASPETLECISSVLRSPTSSITLTEQGLLEPIPRHPDFRLFACMNPATDVGKKDLPPNIRSRFTEIHVPPADADREALIGVITQCLGSCAVGDKPAVMNVAEFYLAVKKLAEERQIVDRSNHSPNFSLRTLVRALTFVADTVNNYGLRRSLWEGCLMAFTMVLDTPSGEVVKALAEKNLLAGVRNPRSLLSKEPSIPHSRSAGEFVKFGSFYLEKGPLPIDLMDDYILTPSVETKLADLARIILTRRFPVLIEGPTSSGKTSTVEYLARRTGHRFIRINNHEHTDIQEYVGSYVCDPVTGNLVFKDGLLVRALRNGDWIVLDELNLAPTDVLEALNRLLDDNRELVIPETHEVVRPHAHFMLFATQNPPGLYAGRKVLSRAFRGRFLEVHFEDVPQAELEFILCQRCRIAPSYCQRIVGVFRELQKRRQSGRVFESKHGFATLRDLFRWAGRDAVGYQELAENGYMLLAERTRREDDRIAVKEVIESEMKVKINTQALYNLHNPNVDYSCFLGCQVPSSSQLVWTSAMQRLFILVTRALRYNEPVLLVGETGSGKTSVCQVYADTVASRLFSLNCHQNTETSDLIGGLRPVRNRSMKQNEIVRELVSTLQGMGVDHTLNTNSLVSTVDTLLKTRRDLTVESRSLLEDARQKMRRLDTMFEWHDGPLVEAMRNGDVFLLDEISLADDSVLERLNSVLDPARTIVLAEQGGNDIDLQTIQAAADFKLLATMNPGGDFGKKELSPALRNRFTEIWVPPITERADFELIVDSLWKYDILKRHTARLLDFGEWLCMKVSDRSFLNLRDVIAWVTFSNSVYHPEDSKKMPLNDIFHHAAHMTFLDGLGSQPQVSAYSAHALSNLKAEALLKLQEIAPRDDSFTFVPYHDPARFAQLGPFAIAKGPCEPVTNVFNLDAATTRDNAMRVVRACQVSKPILLEGSPGVGKTTLIAALANISGHALCRINLSDQTDLVDLFGSDLPVEDGCPGEFAWKDAEFLKALQDGHWVLLDEMNLAPQAILEGLNAILDHRGSVYIPELGRSFTRHPEFRIFAAQNPLCQGGGRKGLPKSFLNRFTKVYLDELSDNDLFFICHQLFPELDIAILHNMITYNARLNEDALKRVFAIEGGPWEFNLRDIVRWGTLLCSSPSPRHPVEFLRTVYLDRFRTLADRNHARCLFKQIFSTPTSTCRTNRIPPPTISSTHLQIGHFYMSRRNLSSMARSGCLLQKQLPILESTGLCASQGWLSILTGPHGSGKSEVVRTLASFLGHKLVEISVNSATDTMDILGSFEQVDDRGRILAAVEHVLSMMDRNFRSIAGSELLQTEDYKLLQEELQRSPNSNSLPLTLRTAANILVERFNLGEQTINQAELLVKLKLSHDASNQFEWIDGPLIRAMKQGDWILLDNANLCNPSVLDRLNSLCEPDGVIILSERGFVNGQVQRLKPHPDFRLFMSVNPQYGELSRAMRNRGIELSVITMLTSEDRTRLEHHFRLPMTSSQDIDFDTFCTTFEVIRRGLIFPKILTPPSDVLWPSGCALDQYSPLSTFVDHAPLLSVVRSPSSPTLEPFMRCFARVATPAYFPHLDRIFSMLGENGHTEASWIQGLLRSSLPRFLSTTAGLRQDYVRSRRLAPEFVLAQPTDFFLTCIPCIDCRLEAESPSPHQTIMQILDVYVALLLNESDIATSKKTRLAEQRMLSQEDVNDREWMAEIDLLVNAVRAASRETLDKMDFGDLALLSGDLKLAFKLLGYIRQLAIVLSNHPLDYSVVHAISKSMAQAVEGCSPRFAQLSGYVKKLEDIISPSSGLGLIEIWATWTTSKPINLPETSLTRLNIDACSLRETVDTYGLRKEVFELMALHTLPVMPNNEQCMTLSHLREQMEQRLSANIQEGTIRSRCRTENSSLIAELPLLFELGGCEDVLIRNDSTWRVNEIIDLTCEMPCGDILRLISYRHVLWATNAGRSTLSAIAHCHLQWVRSLWSTESQDSLAGPQMLFHPTQLRATIQMCDWRRKPLLFLKDYEDSVHRHVRLSFLHCNRVAPRTHQLMAVFQQSLLMIASCYASSFTETTMQMMRDLSCDLQLGTPASSDRILFILEQSKNKQFRDAVQSFLRPALCRCTGPPSRRKAVANLGFCWVSLSRMIVDLYVPDRVIDPAVVQSHAQEIWRQEEETILSQMHLHSGLEQRSTGNDSNDIVAFLSAHLKQISENLAASPQIDRKRHNISRLRIFWKEVSQFLAQVTSNSRIDSFLLSDRVDEAASSREDIVQQSIAGFCQRLDAVYPEYADIAFPLQLALSYLRLGLRLNLHSAIHDSDASPNPVAQACTALVTFPTVRSINILLAAKAETSYPSSKTAFRYLLLKLAAVGLEKSFGVDIEERVHFVEMAYDQIFRLWLIDRAREDEMDLTSQSLYRHKPLDYQAVTDAEVEEREFLVLFPDFEDVLRQDTQPQAKQQLTPLVSFPQILHLVNIHLRLFSASVHASDSSTEMFAIFDDIRLSELGTLLDGQMMLLSDVIDEESPSFQFSLLNNRLSELRCVQNIMSKSFDFYSDPNVLEIKKASAVVSTLKKRLETLIQEWPDQMVLQYLKNHCDLILDLDVHSPVAKMLAAMEQLLLASEDWEIYANRENTLKEHQVAMTGLIIDWRRLELSSWHALLQAQARSFANAATHWWFRLYDITIRGSLDAMSQEPRDVDGFTDYLNKLVPLLDDFIRSSPLGQYHSRMELLGSFADYASRLSLSNASYVRLGLQRVGRILQATIQYYGLFSGPISRHFSEQQAAIEREIQAFIKLASWKDINVYVLKQSAQKTHRQLYKSVRKFRDVMRQPIAQWLQPELAGSAESKPLADHLAITRPFVLPSFPERPSTGSLPAHLVNLNRTFQKFDTLISTQIRTYITSGLAHNVDNLAIDIISTTKSLSTTSVSNSTPTEKREKQRKALLVRKRKAWSDLLKELKRGGLTVNMKPDILARQRDVRWIREIPLMPKLPAVSASVERTETYFSRLQGSLPELRALFSNHHPDVSTRELQRGMTLLESGFAIALDARSCLAGALQTFYGLDRLSLRLKMIEPSNGIVFYHSELPMRISHVRDTLCRLASALDELFHGLKSFNDFRLNRTVSLSTLDEVQKTSATTTALRTQVSVVANDVRLTDFPILLNGERRLIIDIFQHFEFVSSSLGRWLEQETDLRYLFLPVQMWLRSQEMPAFQFSGPEPMVSGSESTDTIIEAILVNVQGLITSCPGFTEDYSATKQDHYIREAHHRLRDLTRLLNLDRIIDHLTSALPGLSRLPTDALQAEMGRFLPFLYRYMELVEEQLIAHSQWIKSLFKLVYVVCSVMHSVAKDGFCKPPDIEESGSGEDSLEAGGVGLGEGSGNENVSKEIEEEFQIEGLQGDAADPQESQQNSEDRNAIEMSEDFDGAMEDISDNSPDEDEDDQESRTDPDEQIGGLDPLDPSTVDEKLWGDEEGPKDTADTKKLDKDHSRDKERSSEMVAKEGEHSESTQNSRDQDGDENRLDEPNEDAMREDNDGSDDGDQHNDASGAAMDDYVQDANTLDLPDSMELELGTELGDDHEDEDRDDPVDDNQAESVAENDTNMEDPSIDDNLTPDPNVQQHQPSEGGEDASDEDGSNHGTVSRPDISTGEDASANESVDTGTTPAGKAMNSAGHDSGEEQSDDREKPFPVNEAEAEPKATDPESAGPLTFGSQQGSAPSRIDKRTPTNPLRDLGDALKEIQRRFEEIQSRDDSNLLEEHLDSTMDVTQVEYAHPKDDDHEMQALGSAGPEQVARLSELKIVDDEVDGPAPMDVDPPLEREINLPHPNLTLSADTIPNSMPEHAEDAIIQSDRLLPRPAVPDPSDLSGPPIIDAEAQTNVVDEGEVEVELRRWQAEGQPSEGAERIWCLYESLTHTLAYVLCEQLRLILEPTLATRLRGDYRTGKRLNMRRIISYIASDYTKDKIWLRRTRPSQREYQVLIALDDSRSMAESHSIHLAYQTLALVSKALSRLEVGDIAIVKFGQAVDVLHGFDNGPFTDRAGTKVMDAFRFDQTATNVLSLVETSLNILQSARERASASISSAGDLWQLGIIISDGICQDHDRLRTVLRKAEEQRVMIVFIIIDSLHSAAPTSHTTSSTQMETNASQNSILSMKQASYKNNDGRMELQLQRYLDSFPFEYYVVLRNVEALPDVLSSTLRQFFERVSEE